EALKQKQPGLGGVSFEDRELAAQLDRGTLTAQMLDRYCTVWMAGLAAEDLVYSNTEGGADDRQKFGMILTPLGYTANAVEQKQRWAVLQARTLLQANWSAYEALVGMMQQRAGVDECCRAIEEHKRDKDDKGDKGEVLI
ncbi:MAG: ATP-dependent Zn protease, partial [Chroococcidiopsis sp.]